MPNYYNSCPLNRLGKKAKQAPQLIALMPVHTVYIEPFFGAGGLFFNKKRAKYNFCNDLDGEVINLYTIIQSDPDELIEQIELLPESAELFRAWRKLDDSPPYMHTPVMRAVRFLFLSNWGLLGKPSTMKLSVDNTKTLLLKAIKKAHKSLIDGTKFENKDFCTFLKNIAIRHEKDKETYFIYADPPYINTGNNYSTDDAKNIGSFTIADTRDLIDALNAFGCKYMISEFECSEITDLAKEYGLFVTVIGERRNLKNTRTEIVLTNYDTQKMVQQSIF